MQCGGHVVPPGGQEVVAEAHLGREPDRVEHAVDATPTIRQRLAHRHAVVGNGDVELVHRHLAGQLARRPLGQPQPAPGTGEGDLGAFVERQPGHAERQ